MGGGFVGDYCSGWVDYWWLADEYRGR